VVNGDEEVQVDSLVDELTVGLGFEHYDARISATRKPSGALDGAWVFPGPDGKRRSLPFIAHPIDDPFPEQRFPFAPDNIEMAKGEAPADFSHVWAIEFERRGAARANFRETETGAVTGNIRGADFDLRYLAGRVFGTTLLLSSFDGGHVLAIRAQLSDDKEHMTGSLHTKDGVEHFKGERRDRVELPSPTDRVAIETGRADSGIAALNKAPYVGQPTIVALLGTWDASSYDQARALERLSRQFEGLQILGLAFEKTPGPGTRERLVEAFRARCTLSFPVEIAGSDSAEDLAKAVPGLKGPIPLPTTLWIDRHGAISGVYAGFSGPASGHGYMELMGVFERLTEQLLAAP